ncbi:MAG: putative lipid II flippase FtsW [Vulcanimicrobiota bacterium]
MKKHADGWVLTIALSLCILGIVMVFSSSLVTTASSYDFNRDPYFFLRRQLVYFVLALICMAVVRRIDLEVWRPWLGFPSVVSAVGLLIMVLIAGPEINGAHRWIIIGGFQFQPAEFAKLAIIFYMADFLARRGEKIQHFIRVVPALAIWGIVLILIEREPDLGTALVVAGVFMAMLYVAGARLFHLGSMAGAGALVVVMSIIAKPYRIKRITAFLNPEQDPQGSGYHAIQSLIALGSGGVLGRGLGASHQKFKYLPEAHTDYIFAILGEELGLLGAAAVLVLFVCLLYKGFRIAVHCRQPYFRFLAAGLTFQLTLQALLNIGVVSGALPSTGIPLPFISYGGTSLLSSLISIGLLLNISEASARHRASRKKPTRKVRRARSGATLTSSREDSVEPVSSGSWERDAAGERLRSSKESLPRPAVEPGLVKQGRVGWGYRRRSLRKSDEWETGSHR